jgi:thiosulfate/3-mercaptopyruvate sulfurtransferase
VSDPRAKTLITVAEPVVLLDVLDEAGAAMEDRPKIPGALSVHLATDFCGKPTMLSGRRPLPEITDLQANARRWGISPGTQVVVYDNAGGAQASRAWWTLRWGGFETVRVLDGGLKAWQAAGKPTSNHVATEAVHAGTVVLKAGGMPTIDAADAARIARSGILLDARGKSNYVGEQGKPATGHIPGARLAASGDNLADGRFKPTGELETQFAALCGDGKCEVAVYCGSGNAAAHALAALHATGRQAALYVGSWSAWSADPNRPVAQGLEPG